MQKRPTLSRLTIGLIGAMVLSATGLLATPTAASAAPNYQLPFRCGDKWRLNTWDSSHAPALDMVHEPQSSTEGATLVAPAGGTVVQSRYHDNAGNLIQIDHGGGHFTTYIHLKSRAVAKGDKVTTGRTIGQVGKTGPTSNGVPHLHYEQGFDENGDGTFEWGFQGSERITAKFDGKAYGPSPGGEWRNVASKNSCKPASSSVSGDAKADLMVHGVGGDVSIRKNMGTYFDGGTNMSNGWGNFLGQPGQGKLYFADFDGDAKDDLIVHGVGGDISVRTNKGTYFDGGTNRSNGWGNFLGQPGQGRLYFADFGGDGKDDLIVHGIGGDISVRTNKGTYFDGGTNTSNGWANFHGQPGQGKLYLS
jgi:hypothetical protein